MSFSLRTRLWAPVSCPPCPGSMTMTLSVRSASFDGAARTLAARGGVGRAVRGTGAPAVAGLEAERVDRGTVAGAVMLGAGGADWDGVHGALSAYCLGTGAAEATAGAPREAGAGPPAPTGGVGAAAAMRGAPPSASAWGVSAEASRRSMT